MPNTTLEPAAQAYRDAVNSGNLDALVAAFHPEAVVIDVNREIKGADAIRRWASNEVIGGRLEIHSATPRPGGTRMLVTFAPGGAGGFRAYYDFDIVDNRIVKANLQYA